MANYGYALSYIVLRYLDECVRSTSAADCSSCQDYTEEHNEVSSSLWLSSANRVEIENVQDGTNYKYIQMLIQDIYLDEYDKDKDN